MPPARPADSDSPPPLPPPSAGDDTPGLPAFHSWPAVYGFVLGCFVTWVGLLVALTEIFG